MIKREQYVNLGKNVLKILSGIVFVYVLTKIIAHTPLIEVMQNVSEEEMKSFLEKYVLLQDLRKQEQEKG